GGCRGTDRRLPAPRSLPCLQRLVARDDAPAPRHAERADGVPHRRGNRVGAGARGERALAELRRVRESAQRHGRRAAPPARASYRSPPVRPFLPARAAAQLQPQVLPGLAPPLRVLRAVDRCAARRRRVPARRAAADAARSVGPRRGSRGCVSATPRKLLVLAAKAAGAVAVVVVIVMWNPFGRSTSPSSAANVQPYASGFDQPTALASNPVEPRRLYVVEQAGRIRYLVGRRVAGTFLDIRSRVGSGGERGLLSVTFSPRYGRDHRFYVDYTDRNGDTHVVEFRSRNGKAIPSSFRQLLFVRQPYPNHNGGQLQFGPDGLLYVGMGDGGSEGDPQNRAQNLEERLGKLLRIDPSRPGARWQVIGYGRRNPGRFSFDRANGDLYIG